MSLFHGPKILCRYFGTCREFFFEFSKNVKFFQKVRFSSKTAWNHIFCLMSSGFKNFEKNWKLPFEFFRSNFWTKSKYLALKICTGKFEIETVLFSKKYLKMERFAKEAFFSENIFSDFFIFLWLLLAIKRVYHLRKPMKRAFNCLVVWKSRFFRQNRTFFTKFWKNIEHFFHFSNDFSQLCGFCSACMLIFRPINNNFWWKSRLKEKYLFSKNVFFGSTIHM